MRTRNNRVALQGHLSTRLYRSTVRCRRPAVLYRLPLLEALLEGRREAGPVAKARARPLVERPVEGGARSDAPIARENPHAVLLKDVGDHVRGVALEDGTRRGVAPIVEESTRRDIAEVGRSNAGHIEWGKDTDDAATQKGGRG